MVEQQQKLILSPYMDIYELIIPKDNLLRQIKELVDFEFIYDGLTNIVLIMGEMPFHLYGCSNIFF